jgi:hypothetical protein
MTVATWPSDLPAPELSGYQDIRQNARRARSDQNGPPRYSRRFSAVAEFVALQMTLTVEQLGIFESFFAETLIEGTQPFYMADPFRDNRWLMDSAGGIIQDSDGLPILVTVNRLCLWGGEPPLMVPRGMNDARVSFALSFLP